MISLIIQYFFFSEGQQKNFSSKVICGSCEIFITDFYIQCAECCYDSGEEVNICLNCFRSGKEFKNHTRCHGYCVKKNLFPVLSPEWNQEEELNLLLQIEKHGFGNWVNIARNISTKSPKECKEHYFKEFLDKPCKALDFLKFVGNVPVKLVPVAKNPSNSVA